MTHKITILYKSGQRVYATCSEFTVKGGGQSFAWVDLQPVPLMFGADNVEAVYQGHVK